MIQLSSWNYGACRPSRTERQLSGGFTLLELCTVLFIMVILLGAMMPAMQSAFEEQSLRNDTRQLSLLVRTAMVQSDEQKQDFVLDLTSSSMALYPAKGAEPKESQATSSQPETTSGNDSDNEAVAIFSLDPNNKLLVPDPKKTNGWLPLASSSWLFQPGELCPAGHVRICRGLAWIELSFQPLTGSAEEEASYIP